MERNKRTGKSRILPRDAQNHHRTESSETVPLCQTRANLSNGGACVENQPPWLRKILTKHGQARPTRNSRKSTEERLVRISGEKVDQSRPRGGPAANGCLQWHPAVSSGADVGGGRSDFASCLLNDRFCISFPAGSLRREKRATSTSFCLSLRLLDRDSTFSFFPDLLRGS